MKLICLFIMISLQAFGFDEVKEYLGLEEAMEPELVLYEDKHEWHIDANTMDLSDETFHKDEKSVIRWGKLNKTNWLDFNAWRKEREKRDQLPHWKFIRRSLDRVEQVGRIMGCYGECFIHRRNGISEVGLRSEVIEGDELSTGKNSTLWLYLHDGSLLKLSPESSLSINEINFSYGLFFFQMRANYGHFHIRPRHIGIHKVSSDSETDKSLLPINVLGSNVEFYERKSFQERKSNEQFFDVEIGRKLHYSALNKMIDNNKNIFQKNNSVFHISSANSTLIAQNSIIDFYTEFGGKTFFRAKKKSTLLNKEDKRKQFLYFFARNPKDRKIKNLAFEKWYEVDPKGQNYEESSSFEDSFRPFDLIVKRIPTLLMTRELFIRKYSRFLLSPYTDEKDMFNIYGFRVWNKTKKDELKRRIDFLNKYLFRYETMMALQIETNPKINEIEKFPTKYYRTFFTGFLLPLKNSYDLSLTGVKKMNNLEYKIWLLKNEKQKNYSGQSEPTP